MQSMGSIKVLPPNSSNTPLVQIIISEPNAQHTLINTLNIQISPFVNLTNIVVNGIMDITLKPHVHPCTITNANAPQVAHQSFYNFEVARPLVTHSQAP
jgi:hypothetical protein